MSVAPPSTAASLVEALERVVGAENVLHHHDELLVYECDGYVIEKKVPDVVVFPTSTEHVVEMVEALQPPRRPVRPAGGGDEPGGGDARRRRRGDDLPDADEADPGDQHPRPLRDRRAGRGQRLADPGLAGTGVPLRARPVEPDRLHDRRQRGDELGRPAHPQVRRDGQPRPGGRAGPARRRRVVEIGGVDRGQPRLRPDRPDRRPRGDLRDRHQGHRQPEPATRRRGGRCWASSTASTRRPRPSAASSPRGSSRRRWRCSTT